MSGMMAGRSDSASRILSLDQFRGYTVFGMFLVNFAGHFAVVPQLFKHENTYCSYADTIMPHFFFAVGMAYRLTFLRRLEKEGPASAYRHTLQRNLGLLLLGIVLYHLDGSAETWARWQQMGVEGFLRHAFLREPFQTLVHIAVTALWILPVITAPAATRIAFACLSGGLHLLLSQRFYYHWVMTYPGIDGGPLGFLTWSIPMIAGSLACDASYAGPTAGRAARRLLEWGVVVMLMGYAIACVNTITPPNASRAGLSFFVEPPFMPPTRAVNLWTMSQRAGSLSYQVFASGLSLSVYAIFIALCDVGRLRVGLFRTLGTNALAAYIIHGMVNRAMRPYTPDDAPLWFVISSFALFLGLCYLFLRHLEKHRLFLRL